MKKSFKHVTELLDASEYEALLRVEEEKRHSLSKVVSMLPQHMRVGAYFPRKGVLSVPVKPYFYMSFTISTPRDIRRTVMKYTKRLGK